VNFSVIVPFLNEELHIEECIKSLLNQSFDGQDYELIFVDNGSEDGSAKIVERYPEIIFLKEEGIRNAYVARNKALEAAKGEIIAFTDADCDISPDWLAVISEGMEKTGAVIALGNRVFPPNVSGALKLMELYDNVKAEFVLSKCPKKWVFGFANNMAVRAEAFEKLGFFDNRDMAGDIEFIQRCVSGLPDVEITYLPNMLVRHLEITTLNKWLNKMFGYGQLIKRTPNYRPLPLRVKVAVYNQICRESSFSAAQRMFFLLLLTWGNLVFKVGEMMAAAEKKA